MEFPDVPGLRKRLAGITVTPTLEEETVEVRVTVLFRPELLRVITAVPPEPAATVIIGGVAIIVKLPVTRIVRIAWRNMAPLVALTVIVYVRPGVLVEVVSVSVELLELPGDSRTEERDRIVVTPDGLVEALRVTLPVKPMLLRVIFAVADPPASKLGGVGEVAVIVKLEPTLMMIRVEWTRRPLVPVTVIL